MLHTQIWFEMEDQVYESFVKQASNYVRRKVQKVLMQYKIGERKMQNAMFF